MKNKNSGFTLMEIMVVIGIVAILAAISIPLYQDYVVRSEVAEGLAEAESQKAAVEEFYSLNGRLPASAEEAGVVEVLSKSGHIAYNTWHMGGFDASNQFTKNAQAGYFDVQMNLSSLDKGLSAFYLEAHVDGKNVLWQCVSPLYRNVSAASAVPLKYLPSVCRAPGSALPMLSAANKTPTPTPTPTPTQNKTPTPVQQVTPIPVQQKTPTLPAQQTPALSCAANQEIVSLSVNGQAISSCVNKCGAGQHRDPNNGAACVADAKPVPACPIGQDCSHKDPKCPAGQEYISATSVPVRDQFTPFRNGEISNYYNTKQKPVSAGCVAKCKDGFVFNPDKLGECSIAPSTNNHACRGPKFICERSHRPQSPGAAGACTVDAPYAANFVENLIDGSRYVTRGCITQKEAYEAHQYNQKHPECKNYNVHDLLDSHFTCTFACYGDACNIETVPKVLLTWSSGKSETDFPDQLDHLTH